MAAVARAARRTLEESGRSASMVGRVKRGAGMARDDTPPKRAGKRGSRLAALNDGSADLPRSATLDSAAAANAKKAAGSPKSAEKEKKKKSTAYGTASEDSKASPTVGDESRTLARKGTSSRTVGDESGGDGKRAGGAGGGGMGAGPASAGGGGLTGVPDAFGGGSNWNTAAAGGGPASYGGMGGAAVKAAEVDNSLVCDPAFMQVTVGAMGSTQSTTQKAGLPFGITLHPMCERPGVEPLPVVNFGAAGVVRCKTCRAYVNPFARFVEGGRRWQCPVCSRANDVPSAYFAPLDDKGVRTDVAERPELSRGSVEFVAPSEYMVRPPQAPVYMFVIDVSYNAVASGAVAATVEAIKASLDSLPGEARTQVGFLTYDSTIHFYNLKSTLSAPQMLVVSDIAEPFLPVPDDLLVNLSDSRTVVDALLDSLPDMFAGTSIVESCMGPALLSAHAVMKHIGGKMIVLQASLPSLGPGKLRHRENAKLLGTDSEHSMLNAEDPFYKNQAIEFSKVQISCDLFLTSPSYTDVATLSDLSRLTAGHVYHYPAFNHARDAARFRADLSHDLERTTGWEAVMRVRCSRGVRVTNFHGNFYMRSQDLLALPNVTSDTACTVDLEYVDALQPGTVVVIQAALLYTTSSGERRICVHTAAVPVTTNVLDIYRGVDVEAVTNLVAARALEAARRTGLMSARQMLHRKCVDVMRCFRAAQSSGFGAKVQTSGMPLPDNLQLLPLYMMALQKSVLFRGGQDVGTDERSFLMYQAAGMSVARGATFVYPRLYSLHNMPDAAGRPHPEGAPMVGEDGSTITVAGEARIRLPGVTNLSSERLSSDAVLLLDDGVEMLLWVGRAAPPGLLEALLGVHSLEGVDMATFVPARQDNEFSARVWDIMGALREGHPVQQRLLIVREGAGDFAERRFHWRLVEDRQGFAGAGVTYADYLAAASRESMQSAAVTGGGGAR
uniref:Protein transport protein SEC24 n=1 Tax=Bicosoecida sp. CB-2014 TaxID=1486930 RepID=A0A7S1CB04_9STRA|mmetsp:Transcript_18148/g.64278  ORF Transcript_18148/g.64278 Transcript_18148/m.64278 type:complete len:954 (+) Transcript_18148:363-3224(+)